MDDFPEKEAKGSNPWQVDRYNPLVKHHRRDKVSPADGECPLRKRGRAVFQFRFCNVLRT